MSTLSSRKCLDKLEYEVVEEREYLDKPIAEIDFKKIKNGGLEIDLNLENKDEYGGIKEKADIDKIKLKKFYKNLTSSPFPRAEGQFSERVAFRDRCQLMKMVVKDKIFKSLIRRGDGPQVTADDAVLFNINAFIVESYEEPFDSSFGRKKPLLSKLDRLVEGYALSLLTMKVGELSEFAIHHSLAFGVFGCLPRIPPCSDVIVIFEVVDLYAKGDIEYHHSLSKLEQGDELKPEQILQFAINDRKIGSDLYREGNYHKALFYYRRAIDMLEGNLTEQLVEDECNVVLLTLYHNAANCQIHLSRGPSIINFARRALRIDPESVKANYQLGKGYLLLGKYDKAKYYLSKARQFRQFDVDINRELEILDKKLVVENMDSKALYKQMAKGIIAEGEEVGKDSKAQSEATVSAELAPKPEEK